MAAAALAAIPHSARGIPHSSARGNSAQRPRHSPQQRPRRRGGPPDANRCEW